MTSKRMIATSEADAAWGTAGKFIIGSAVLILSVFLRGVSLRSLWLWFVVPLGVLPINMWHAFGIATLVGMLTHRDDQSTKERSTGMLLAASVLVPVFALLFGYLFHLAS